MLSDHNDNPLAKEMDQRVQSGQLEIPMLPDVAQKVLRITNDPDSDANQLMKVIQGDQALAARVMRIANSAAYTPSASIVSLQQAIARLGMMVIRDIALATSLNARMFKAPGYEGEIAAMWEHALTSALWSKEIARKARKNVEAAFLCGLLHSIGKPIILQETLDNAASDDYQVPPSVVMEIVDELHIDAARLALLHWKMPDLVVDAVTHQNDYADAGVGQDQAKIIRAARLFAEHTLRGEPTEAELLTLPVLADLNLYENEIADLYAMKDAVKQGLEAMRV